MIALDADEAALRQSIVGVCRKFARRDLGFPIGAAQLVSHHFSTIQPMLDMRAVDEDARRVPLAEWSCYASRRSVQTVRRRRGGQWAAAIGRVDVIEELILRRAPIDVLVFPRAAIKNAAVARIDDLPFEFEFEVSELLASHEVFDLAILGERTIHDMPSRRKNARNPSAP